MKKIFVIEANAKEHSKKEVYVSTYIEEAQKLGHEVRRINVYDLHIDYLRFEGETPCCDLSEELKQAQDNLIWAEQLVFVYPLWCFAIPAILKSFIERTFRDGVIWKMGKMGPEPVYKDKTAVIMQSYGMPYIGMKLLGDIPFKFWKVLIEKWCGVKIVKRFDFEMIDEISEKRNEKWLKDIKKFVKTL